MVRSFIALELPRSLKDELVAVIDRFKGRAPLGVNWVKPENLHLTLLFIGDVAPERIREIDAEIQRLLEGFPAFKFKALGLELFPASDPRLIWLKLQEENDDVFKLQRRMVGSVRSLGLEPDRKPLKLHVTLARIKSHVEPELAREIMQYEIDKQSLEYGSICLFRSVLHPTGPSYSILEQYNLK